MMKNTILILISLSVASIVYANDKNFSFPCHHGDDDEIHTIFDVQSHGGFGGIDVMYSLIDQRDAMSIGARGGWIIGHNFSLGFGGSGFFNWIQTDKNGLANNLTGGYFGTYFEPILLPKFPIHLSIPIFIGAGSINYMEYDDPDAQPGDNAINSGSDNFFITEPGAELEFNLVKHCRLSFGVYYTYTSKIKFNEGQVLTSDRPMNSLKYGITLKLGSF